MSPFGPGANLGAMPTVLGSASHPQFERFRDLTSRMRDLVLIEGIVAQPFSDPALPYFAALSDESREEMLRHFEIFLLIVSRASYEGLDISKSTRRLSLDFLREAGLQPAPDLLEHLEDDDHLAAYNHRQQIVFLTPNHFRLMSYSIEDLYCRPWPMLFQRSEQIEKVLVSRALEFGRGLHTKTLVHSDVPPHLLTEINGPEKRTGTAQSKVYSPVFRNGRPAGFVAVNRARLSPS